MSAGDQLAPRYGTPNADYFASILQRTEPDGPMWALNLIKHRKRAVYADGRDTMLSGEEADNEYAPIEQLAAVGARPVFVGSVVHQLVGDHIRWNRIGIVRYPTRRSIIEMSMREDFQAKHVHKEAGVECTIVAASFPFEVNDVPSSTDDLMLLQLVGAADTADIASDFESTRIATFSIEDVLIGDGRRFAEARYDRVQPHVADELKQRAYVDTSASYAVLVAAFINQLASSTTV